MIYDKTGREIRIGDTLKIFSFIGKRKKHYYMYKYVKDVREFPTHKLFIISHLNQKDEYFHLLIDEKIHSDIEIVQGYNNKDNELSFEDRPKIKTNN